LGDEYLSPVCREIMETRSEVERQPAVEESVREERIMIIKRMGIQIRQVAQGVHEHEKDENQKVNEQFFVEEPYIAEDYSADTYDRNNIC
jgi:hypothetical protein